MNRSLIAFGILGISLCAGCSDENSPTASSSAQGTSSTGIAASPALGSSPTGTAEVPLSVTLGRKVDDVDVATLLDSCLSDDVNMQGRAAITIAVHGPELIPKVEPYLRSWLLTRRMAAVHLLGSLGPEALPALRKELQTGSDVSRELVLVGIEKMGPAAAAAIPDIAAALTRKRTGLRRRALEVLGNFGPAATTTTAQIVPLLNDQDEKVRLQSIATLGQIGDKSSVVLQGLKAKLESGNDAEKEAARQALAEIRGSKP